MLLHNIYVTNNVIISTIAKKIVKLKNILFNRNIIITKLKEMFYVFKFLLTLLSTFQFTKQNNFVIFDKKKCFIKNKITNNFVMYIFNCRN